MSTVKLITKNGQTLTIESAAMTAERTVTVPNYDTDLRQYVPGGISVLTGFGEWTGSGAYWSYARPTFTLLRGGYGYIRGSKITFGAGLTVDVTLNAANYIYINASAQLLAAPNTITLYTNRIPLFELIDDGASGVFVKKENHSVNFNATISSYIHNNIGNIVRGTGAVVARMSALTTGTTQVQIQYKIVGEDTIEDHGLETTIPDSAGVAITADYWYLNGAGKWIRHSNGASPPLYYTSAGVPTILSGGSRGIIKIYVTQDDLNTTTPRYIGVLHSAQFGNLSSANVVVGDGSAVSPTNELLAMELVQLGYIVVRNTGAFGYIEQVTVQKSTANARYIGGTAGSSHLTLSDLSGGQYADAGHTGLVTRFVSTVPPTANSDTTLFKVGSLWVDSVAQRCYMSTNVTDAAAVWPKLAYSTDTAFGVGTTAASGAVAIGDGLASAANIVRVGGSTVTDNYFNGNINSTGDTITASVRVSGSTSIDGSTINSAGIGWVGGQGAMVLRLNRGGGAGGFFFQQYTDLGVVEDETTINKASFNMKKYSTTATTTSAITLAKSRNNTFGTNTATASQDYLGAIIGAGVNAAPAAYRGAAIVFRQEGAADATGFLSNILFQTADKSADNGTMSSAHLVSRVTIGSTGTLYALFGLNVTGSVTQSAVKSAASLATDANGQIVVGASDQTMKIADGFLVDGALAKIAQMQPRYYYWKPEYNMVPARQLGFYAQEINAVLGDEVANPPPEGTHWAYNHNGVIAYLTKGVQELIVRNAELFATVQNMETRLAASESVLAKL